MVATTNSKLNFVIMVESHDGGQDPLKDSWNDNEYQIIMTTARTAMLELHLVVAAGTATDAKAITVTDVGRDR